MSLTIFYSRARTLQIPGSYSGVGTNFAHISASDYAYFVYRFIFFSFSSRFLIIIILCCSASLHQMWRCIFCHSATHMKSHKMPINNFVLLASFHSPITYKKILVLLHTDKHRTNRAQQSTLNSKIVQSDQRHHIHFQLYRNSALQEHQVNWWKATPWLNAIQPETGLCVLFVGVGYVIIWIRRTTMLLSLPHHTRERCVRGACCLVVLGRFCRHIVWTECSSALRSVAVRREDIGDSLGGMDKCTWSTIGRAPLYFMCYWRKMVYTKNRKLAICPMEWVWGNTMRCVQQEKELF